MSKIKSFRGLITDGGQDRVHLRTNDGSTGYKIVKFEIWPTDSFGVANLELVGKVTQTEQTVIDDAFNFSDQDILAGAYFTISTGALASKAVIFDNMVFNQDIFVSMVDQSGNLAGNYYLELEQMKLNLNENTVATLKDIRNITRSTPT